MAHGDAAGADQRFLAVEPLLHPNLFAIGDPAFTGVMFSSFAIAFLHAQHGGDFQVEVRKAQNRSGRMWMQSISCQSRYLLGEITDAQFLARPYRLYAAAELELLKALKADQAGLKKQAWTAYRQWQRIPPYRRSEAPDPAWEEFTAWRSAQLALP